MRLFGLILLIALLAAFSAIAEAPAPDTVANCSTDWECENGPDETNPFKDE